MTYDLVYRVVPDCIVTTLSEGIKESDIKMQDISSRVTLYYIGASLQASMNRDSYFNLVTIMSLIVIFIYFQNPILKTVYWLLTTITCQIVDCPSAKEAFAEDNMAVSLNRLWPWCMLTDQLRAAVVYLLFVFSNDCPKGN